MRTEPYLFELITPCFCAGAEPSTQAEIRAPAVRGQLRWWFRTLGGFASLQPKSVREQEDMIFGAIAGEEGQAGKLIVRVESHALVTVRKDGKKLGHADGQELGHPNSSASAYLTFPVQTREKHGVKEGYSGRGVFTSGTFVLRLLWRGPASQWDDIRALTCVFANLGALGFRARRAMGALHLMNPSLDLKKSLAHFSTPNAITVFELPAADARDAVSKLASWLRGWRQHGQTSHHVPMPPPANPPNPGFDYALRDHDEGLVGLGRARPSPPASRPSGRTPLGRNNDSFRPAIGLPLVQFFSSLHKTVNWNATADGGRFASPILLRPHRDSTGWRALVIFLDTRQWDYTKPVHLDSGPSPRTRQVLPDLYNEMKKHAAATMTRFQ